MNYLPVNGLRIFVVEGSTLFASFLLLWLAMRFFPTSTKSSMWLSWLLASDSRGVILVVAAALLARGLLLPFVGIPEPRINDEYSYLLMADTFAHHRLTNPTPAAWQHFETFHVNMQPTYHSKYPVAQGLVLAAGRMMFHQPWVGVYLSTALLCGAICWTLQAFVTPGWALIGGLMAVVRIALFSFWTNSYFGVSVAALGGALALGTVVRLFHPDISRRSRVFLACGFSAGLMILATSRPYEGLAFSIPLFAYFIYHLIKQRKQIQFVRDSLVPVFLIGTMGVVAMGYYNHATTGDTLLQPYPLNYRLYWPLPLFLGQKDNRQIAPADPAFAKYFETIKNEYEFEKTKTLPGVLSLESRRFWEDWFFYVGPALTLPLLVGILSCAIQPRLRIVVLAATSTAIALALYIYSMTHYAAVATIAVFVFTVEGLRYLWDQQQRGERAVVIAVLITVLLASVTKQTGITNMNTAFHFQNQRRLIAEQLQGKPGQHLVLVSYDFDHHYPGNELIHNGADFRSEKILWARSKGRENDLDLCRAYPDRSFWSVTTDDIHFSLNAIDLCR
jgi:hypothetical protein